MQRQFTVFFLLLVTAVMALAAPQPVKNVIVMISDGCGYNQIAATDYYQYGAPGTQVYENFPVQLAMSTFSINGKGYNPARAKREFDYVKSGPTDSAAAATAMACGVKTYDAAIGVDANKKVLPNVLERAEKLGKATGVITSVQISHATPAGFVAHNESRGNYEAIGKEMLLTSTADVIMGAGHPLYNDAGQPIAEPKEFQYVGGKDTWEQLVAGKAGADANGDGKADPWTLVQTRADFQKLMDGDTPARVCGIAPVHTTLQQSRPGDGNAAPGVVAQNDNVPALAEMAKAALNVLDNDPDGLFLMIEGGAIDWASHGNQTGRMIEEEMAFNTAVEAVVQWVEEHSNWDETVLIVTGDHETGYPTGLKSGSDANGDGQPDPVWVAVENRGKGVLPGVEWHTGGHTNNLIPLFAKGANVQNLRTFADEYDAVRGQYMDNTEVAKFVFSVLQ